ncbi:MAG TPA: tRNA pseudouridine(55) synthase TruB [bacterium]|mgnify:CR=1 FL=1|nr:tRNA pseudouridine(55) synthase TruB [bacterium]
MKKIEFEDSGFFNVFKPPGMTSQDVVGYLKWRLKPGKIGHAGTLDPLACGVLVCMVNKATRLMNKMSATRKTYIAEAVFGYKTDTGDLGGSIVETSQKQPTGDDIELVLEKFRGDIEQIPPMVSAIKKDGQPLYKLARQGIEIERAPRPVTIYNLRMLRFYPETRKPGALFEVECSGGTYIRTLMEDIAAAAGCVATTAFLVRTAVGPFGIDNAVNPQDIKPGPAEQLLLPPEYLQSAEEELF